MTPKMQQLRDMTPYWYLATVFTSHPNGPEIAFRQAASVAAFFMRLGIPVFCPIAHGYPAQYTGMLEASHDFWMAVDQPFMDTAGGLIVVKMPNWEKSSGITEEIAVFEQAGKPVLYMEYPPSYGVDDAAMMAYYAEAEKDHDLRDPVLAEWPEPTHFDSAFNTKEELL